MRHLHTRSLNTLQSCGQTLVWGVGMLLCFWLSLWSGEAAAQLRAPEWYTHPPEAHERWYGAGVAPRRGKPTMALEAAEANALRDLARRMQVSVEGHYSRMLLEVSGTGQPALQEEVTSQVRLLVQASLPETRVEQRTCPIFSGACYVLISLDGQTLESALKSKEKALASLRPALDAALERLLATGDPAMGTRGVASLSPPQLVIAPILSEQMRQTLELTDGLETQVGVYLRARLEEALIRQTKRRVLRMEQRMTTGKTTESMQVISGQYREELGHATSTLILSLRLEDVGRTQLLKSEEVVLSRAAVPVPDEPPLEPLSRLERRLLEVDGATGRMALQLELAPTRGRGARYREGDLLEIRVRADHDCHLRLFTATTEGRVKLLFPNPLWLDDLLHAGADRILGAPEAGYVFPIEPPLGVEVLSAVCSSLPFTDATALSERLKKLSDYELIPLEDVDAMARWIQGSIAPGARSGRASSPYWVSP